MRGDHSVTSSASASSVGGISGPIHFPVFRLLPPIADRQFDRDVRRRAYHDRASIRASSTPECLDEQHELFREHGLYSLNTGFPFSRATATDWELKPARLLFPDGFVEHQKWFLRFCR
jgi:hypothetical protein